MTEVTASDVQARKARHLQIGDHLDAANACVRAALSGGDDREYAAALLERAWVAMLMRDLHGRTTVLGRTWEQHMLRDIELALRACRHVAP